MKLNVSNKNRILEAEMGLKYGAGLMTRFLIKINFNNHKKSKERKTNSANNLVDTLSSDTLPIKIKPCMS